jgi:transposase
MSKRGRYPQEVRERAVRMVQEQRGEYPSEWAAVTSIAGKLGVGTEALRLWLRRAEIDQHQRPGTTSTDRERLRELERENRELRRANESLTAASAFFARELGPRLPKP